MQSTPLHHSQKDIVTSLPMVTDGQLWTRVVVIQKELINREALLFYIYIYIVYIYIYLVGGLEHCFYMFLRLSIYWNVIIPTDELIFFRGVETTNQSTSICKCRYLSKYIYIYIYIHIIIYWYSQFRTQLFKAAQHLKWFLYSLVVLLPIIQSFYVKHVYVLIVFDYWIDFLL